ncbi:hypothetical protein L204_101841 [Cryptococcus depauperatus]
MRHITSILFSAVLLLSTSSLAMPTAESRHELVPRGEYIGLWNGTGPVVYDVKQVSVLNCWWAASTLSVLIASQNWVMNMIRYGNVAPMAGVSWPQDGTVLVQIWNPYTLEPEYEIAYADKKSTTEDHYYGPWWHDALSQAAKTFATRVEFPGIFHSNGTFDPTQGSAKIGLSLLTGFKSTSKLTSDYPDADAFWADLARASQNTPVIFNTVSKDYIGTTKPQLGDSHDYAVFNGTIKADGSKTIWARNSWGSTDEFELQDVYKNTYQIFHLEDWNNLEQKGDHYPFSILNTNRRT